MVKNCHTKNPRIIDKSIQSTAYISRVDPENPTNNNISSVPDPPAFIWKIKM
jgi:hypothetical protein